MKKIILSILILFHGVVSISYAQDDYKFHSMFVMNFLKYIQWPESSAQPEFVIGVLGNETVMPDLERIASTRYVNGKKIIVKRFSDVSKVSDCQLLYIPTPKSNELAEAIKQVGAGTLIVTAKDGLAQKGSCINFVVRDGKWRFEINEHATGKAKLKVSGELSRLAIMVG
ncbi:protein of unknown function [Flexibacter flexilis DSM 6793]|uniref:YfiR family protein n=1 Tax=Flexibacter flexilis DSM 6793 TaxID=927664 RepID=A0A1I1DAU5_9BACT|nr:YfiR family protein [Flexibacter flexilis]SFB72129.1 protein of unknown function [Flexibacter flexilis DSM 6793]